MHIRENKVAQIVGVDVGGSHITAAKVSNDQIVQDSYFERKLDSGADAETILATWLETIRKAIGDPEQYDTSIAVAMPGPFDYENGISLIKGMQKYESLYGLNIRSIFSEQLNIRPENIQFFNDAKCFVQGEATSGAAKGFRKVIGITLGTGVGSAVCTDMHAVDVNRGSSPFLDGIVEEYLSTRWFIERYFQLTGNQIDNVQSLFNGNIITKAREQIFDEFTNNLSDFLQDFVQAELPDAIVIGGGITNAATEFLPRVETKLHASFPQLVVRKTKLWDNASLIGASSALTITQLNILSA
ncbi:ROK family protein [Pedobacter sandarakinus]|uniref:ROK family protein n=1 Tax=Pedobacter sandarakinus TaxID=353156 RepID=UPI0022459A91|nr:ROK family protein [Pedobacter sandarakinus]MCX2574108.1 ROK family protein [Pedobacter sandarakinus]